MTNHLVRVFAVLACALPGCTSEAAEVPTSRPSANAPVAKNLDVAAAVELLGTEADIVILDVRTEKEFDAGHIADAVLLDYRSEDFAGRLADLNRTDTYLVHCESGGRSSAAFEQMKKLEFVSIYHLDGGMRAWRESKQAVVK